MRSSTAATCTRYISPDTAAIERHWHIGRDDAWRGDELFPRSLGPFIRAGAALESYTMLTINADDHPLMRRMRKPDPKLAPDRQDKRSVVAIELEDVDRWLHAPMAEATRLVRPPAPQLIDARPALA